MLLLDERAQVTHLFFMQPGLALKGLMPAVTLDVQIRDLTLSSAERGTPGAFTLQLILDNGADEYIVRPTAEDADVLLVLWARSESATFDLARKVLMFSSVAH